MKPTIKNLAAFSGKGTATLQRWKKYKNPIYNIIKNQFMLMNNVTKIHTKTK